MPFYHLTFSVCFPCAVKPMRLKDTHNSSVNEYKDVFIVHIFWTEIVQTLICGGVVAFLQSAHRESSGAPDCQLIRSTFPFLHSQSRRAPSIRGPWGFSPA